MSDELAIKERLLQFWESRDKKLLLPALSAEAQELVYTNPFAFLLAGCLDRGMIADIVWTFPFYLKQDLGHLDPYRIAMMSIDEIRAALERIPKKPRYMRDAPRTVQELVAMVSGRLSGDAAKLWQDRTARAVQDDLMKIYPARLIAVNEGVVANFDKRGGRTIHDFSMCWHDASQRL